METITIAERLWLEPTILGVTLNHITESNGVHFRVGMGYNSLITCDHMLQRDAFQWTLKDGSLLLMGDSETVYMVFPFKADPSLQRSCMLNREETLIFKRAIHFLVQSFGPTWN